jgi:hypothetical protein
MLLMVRVAVAFVLMMLLSVVAHAEKRVALVIGNSAYKFAGELANPKNDATDIAGALKKLSFQVIDGYDLDKAALDRKIRDFATTLQGADVGLFFYAGHGLQVAGQNYLVPTDAQAETASALDFEMVRLDLVHRTMEREAATNIIFLDACRNNPLARNLARALGTRSTQIGRGLAVVESGVGTLISFSTSPGNVASDGSGRNSPFAGALVKHISSSKDDISAILIEVRNDVMSETRGNQVPWEHSALRGRFYFDTAKRGETGVAGPVPAWRLSEAAEVWDRTKDTTNSTVLEAFIARYKDTFYAELARARLEELKTKRAAVVPPRPATPCQGVETLVDNKRRCLKWSETFKDCRECPEMMVVPAGAFMMGSEENGTERPIHKVTIAKPFAVGKFEVTFWEWDACLVAGGCKLRPDDAGRGRGKRPVINVSWDDITMEYLPWLTRVTGAAYRLPTEAEWEYTARAGSSRKYTWGDEISDLECLWLRVTLLVPALVVENAGWNGMFV